MSSHEDVLTTASGSESADTSTQKAASNTYHIPSNYLLAWKDFISSLALWRVWSMLAYQDIQLRYRRSVLGPFWITISMAITVYSMGYLYSHIFHQDLSRYYPFLTTGMLAWTLISTIITDITEGLVSAEALIKQIKLPYTLYIHRIACRNLLIFLHNLFVYIPILVVFHSTTKVNLYSFLLIPGLFIIYVNTLSFGLVISMLGARYRDIAQVIKSLLQVVFFVTPIMWSPEVLGERGQFLASLNPVYAILELIRQPLLGLPPSFNAVLTSTIITIVGIAICINFFSKYRARIVYWL